MANERNTCALELGLCEICRQRKADRVAEGRELCEGCWQEYLSLVALERLRP